MSTNTATPTVPLSLVAVATVVGTVIGYTLAVDPVVYSPSQVVYPVVWGTVSLASLWLVRDRLADLTLPALAVGMAYTVALLWTAGLLGPSSGPAGLSVHFALPGWGPAIVYTSSMLTVVVVPFLFVGYVALGLLAASALQVTLGTTVAGVVGLFACVSCTAPLLAGLVGSLGSGSLAAAIATAQYPLATAAFLLSAGGLTVFARRVPTKAKQE